MAFKVITLKYNLIISFLFCAFWFKTQIILNTEPPLMGKCLVTFLAQSPTFPSCFVSTPTISKDLPLPKHTLSCVTTNNWRIFQKTVNSKRGWVTSQSLCTFKACDGILHLVGTQSVFYKWMNSGTNWQRRNERGLIPYRNIFQASNTKNAKCNFFLCLIPFSCKLRYPLEIEL